MVHVQTIWNWPSINAPMTLNINAIEMYDNTLSTFKWQGWKLTGLIIFVTLNALIGLGGQGLIISYIHRYGPKRRLLNRLILLDQVIAFFLNARSKSLLES